MTELITKFAGQSKIIVVDNSEDQLTQVEMTLKKSLPTLTILKTKSGKQGIEMAQKEEPDTMILGIEISDIDGFKVCTILKMHEQTRHIPVIMFTGEKNDCNSRVKALEMGADAFLHKPIDSSELTAQVKAMLRIKWAEDKLRKEKEALKHLVDTKSFELHFEKEKQRKSLEKIKLYAEIVDKMQLGLFLYHMENVNDDHTLRMIHANPMGCEIIGVLDTELIGKTLDENFPFLRELGIPAEYAEVVRTQTPLEFENIEYEDERVKRANFSVRAVPLPGNHVGILFENITLQKRAEMAISNSLKEKETLLKEIHHRVKNNLTMVSSLLNIQSSYIKDEQSRAAFAESRKRIASIALVYEKLYRSSDQGKIYFHPYTKELADGLLQSYSISRDTVECRLDIPEIQFNTNTTIPLGLIITELISNSFKYGVIENQKLCITISLKEEENYLKLTVQDNGPGIDQNMDWRNTETLGLQLVILLSEQLGGKIELETGHGATFHILFPQRENLEKTRSIKMDPQATSIR